MFSSIVHHMVLSLGYHSATLKLLLYFRTKIMSQEDLNRETREGFLTVYKVGTYSHSVDGQAVSVDGWMKGINMITQNSRDDTFVVYILSHYIQIINKSTFNIWYN